MAVRETDPRNDRLKETVSWERKGKRCAETCENFVGILKSNSVTFYIVNLCIKYK